MIQFAPVILLLFFFNPTATTVIYTLSLHDALPIFNSAAWYQNGPLTTVTNVGLTTADSNGGSLISKIGLDRKSTRLNSSHVSISYAVFCLKKKTTVRYRPHPSTRRGSLPMPPRSVL